MFKQVVLVVSLVLVVLVAPAAAQPPAGCVNGRLEDAKAYVLGDVLHVAEGASAANWQGLLEQSGIPATSSVAGTVAGSEFYGITQWKGSAGNVRGRLSLPTELADALGYKTRSVDVLADNPVWAVPCHANPAACVWAWKEDAGAPPYAPRTCSSNTTTIPLPSTSTPPNGEVTDLRERLIELDQRVSAQLDELRQSDDTVIARVRELVEQLVAEALTNLVVRGDTASGLYGTHRHTVDLPVVKR